MAGCGGSETAPLAVVSRASPTLANEMNAICTKSTTALVRWARSRSQDLTAPARALRREGRQLRGLHASAGEEQALAQFVASVDKLADVYTTLSWRTDPEAFHDAVVQSQAPGQRATRLALEMHATSCARQMSGRAR